MKSARSNRPAAFAPDVVGLGSTADTLLGGIYQCRIRLSEGHVKAIVASPFGTKDLANLLNDMALHYSEDPPSLKKYK